eukprot:TRINITY_DN1388_c0_g1_i1.p2 TRINITY_DN1388_c0_g1~~TRINITY_DN1388_c0_g1_i1.p2  ORF type:complete len:202 (-),score=33.92 TRINITY_DN1388_c0_g1_i1:105-674(-)
MKVSLVGCLVVLLAVVSSTNAFCLDPSTPGPSDFNAKFMLGTWRQVYANELAFDWVERNTVCIAAQYGLNPNGTISVNNTARKVTPNGDLYQILGWAVASRPNYPAELTVSLQGVYFPAPLWWLNTSDSSTGRYEWAIGSDPVCATLFVLSRNWPIPSAYLPAIDKALAYYDWYRSGLVEIKWQGCPPI